MNKLIYVILEFFACLAFIKCDFNNIQNINSSEKQLSDTTAWLAVGDPLEIQYDRKKEQIIFLTNQLQKHTFISGPHPYNTRFEHKGNWLVNYDLKNRKIKSFYKVDSDYLVKGNYYNWVDSVRLNIKSSKIELLDFKNAILDSIVLPSSEFVINSKGNVIIIQDEKGMQVCFVDKKALSSMFFTKHINIHSLKDIDVISIDTINKSVLVIFTCISSDLNKMKNQIDGETGNCHQLASINQDGIKYLKLGYENYLISGCGTNRNGEAFAFYSPGIVHLLNNRFEKWKIRDLDYTWFNTLCYITKDEYIGFKNNLSYSINLNHQVRTDTLYIEK